MIFDADGNPGCLGSGNMRFHFFGKSLHCGFEFIPFKSLRAAAAADQQLAAELGTHVHFRLQLERAEVVTRDAAKPNVVPLEQ